MTENLTLREALIVLAKSSRYAVEVENGESAKLQAYKDYLYVESPVESAFLDCLSKMRRGDMVFLCGSSGDGKSAIMARHHADYEDWVHFHLDATHSFSPEENAVDALDRLFSKVKDSGKPLAVGINIGMLANYAQEGAEEHRDIKLSFQAFLESRTPSLNHHFISFSQYPKFTLTEGGGRSSFVQQLLTLLTKKSNANPFFVLSQDQQADDRKLYVNFALLSDEGVQKVLVDLLLQARLYNDQFLTARALLDFIYHLLTADGYLFENLFIPSDNELADSVAVFDPAKIRDQKIDDFILRHELGLTDSEFDIYPNQLKEKFGIDHANNLASYVRLFFLLQHSRFGNNYHRRFKCSFESPVLHKYAWFWSLHKKIEENYGSTKDVEAALRNEFYKNIFVKALTKYMNRNARLLKKRHLLLGRRSGFDLAAYTEIQPDFGREAEDSTIEIGYFTAFVKANGVRIPPIRVSISLLDLMVRINSGYRPSKHDKSVIVILEEIVDCIVEQALKEKSVFVYGNGACVEFKRLEDESIEVQGRG